jgi:hypothetical protein
VTKASDPFPTIIDGIPLQIGHVNVSIDRPGLHVQPDQLQTDERGGDGDGRRRGELVPIGAASGSQTATDFKPSQATALSKTRNHKEKGKAGT